MAKRQIAGEKYYTNGSLAKRCADFTKQLLPQKMFDLVVEPSAGGGAFIPHIAHFGKRILALDIEPQGDGVAQGDFLLFPVERFKKQSVLTIGNPPFGARGKLAMSFIEKASQYSNAIAFILPRSFKKDTFTNRIPRQFHLLGQFDCDDFATPEGDKVSVKCVFQVWEKRDSPRKVTERIVDHPDFELKHAHMSRISGQQREELNSYDFAIAQVGSNFAPKDVGAVKSGSYWFVKARTQGVREVFAVLDFSFLDGMNTVFKSLSKKDIVQAYIAAKDS